jgi:Domain of unknown function (DUF802)
MTRFLYFASFLAGLATVGWIAAGYAGANPLALAVTVLVGAFYLMGTLELHRFQQATATLAQALAQLAEAPAGLGPWLARIHPSLQNAVRLRIEGERVGLPGPALTPYLAGLLVLLGMLGTFLGMVVTLNGTGMALESATDLQAIRASLSAPVKGLGLAFGTSVAGVMASAMLGLLSVLCRRDRLMAAQVLDTQIATTLRAFSLAHQRDESFKLLQQQTELMPALVDRLQAMMATMAQQSQALDERLANGQQSFHAHAEKAYTSLAASVDRSLQASLGDSTRAAGAAIQPLVEATMAGMAREAAALHETMGRHAQHQLDGLASRLETTAATAGALWNTALAEHARTSQGLTAGLQASLERFAATFEQRSATLLQSVDQAHAGLQTAIASRDAQRLASWTDALGAMAESLRQEWQQAGALAAVQQAHLGQALERAVGEMHTRAEAQASHTIAEVGRLVQLASQAPQAAAEVIAELRQNMSDSMVRDNAMLDERKRLLETLGTLLAAVNHASSEQRVAIDALVGASADLLDRVGSRFMEKVDAQAEKMTATAAQITGSAVEVASLGEAFGFAVQRFGESNDKLVAQLQRIEGALGKSMARSDEQLAYYVAQAREVIDLSIMSQQQIVEDLQQLAAGQRAAAVSQA